MLKNTKRKIIAAFLVLLVVSVACIPNDWLHAEGENSESGGNKVEETVSPADGVTIENYERKYSVDEKKYYFKNKQGEVSEGGQVFEPVKVIIDKEKYQSVEVKDEADIVNNSGDNFVVELSLEGEYIFELTPKAPVKEDTDSSETDTTTEEEHDLEITAGAAEAIVANSDPEAADDTSATTTETEADDASDTTAEMETDDTSATTTEAEAEKTVCFTVVLDNTKPSITSVTGKFKAEDKEHYYEVEATDHSGAGIKAIYYSDFSLTSSNSRLELSESDIEKHAKLLSGGRTGEISESADKVTYYFYAIDYLGQIADQKKEETNIDYTAPTYKIRILSENCGQEDSGIYYFNKNAVLENTEVLKISFSDNISGMQDNGVELKNEDDPHAVIEENSVFIKLNENTKEGEEYTITVYGTDKKNNKTEAIVTFIYDKTRPDISELLIADAELADEEAGAGQYYRQGEVKDRAKIEFTLEEQYLKSVNLFLGKECIELTGNQTQNQTENHYSYTLDKDFENQDIKVIAVDYAGNQFERTLKNITYDTKKPELENIIIVHDDSSQELLDSAKDAKEKNGVVWGYNKGNTLTLTFQEKNFSKEKLNILYGRVGETQKVLYNGSIPEEKQPIKANISDKKNGSVTVVMPDVALDDGTYRFTVRCKDKAGNEMEEVNKYIMVDTRPPVLKLSKEMGMVDVPEQQPHRQQKQKSVKLHLEAADANLKDIGMFTWKLQVTDSKNAAIERLSYKVSHADGTAVEYRDADISTLQAYLGTKENWVDTKKDNTYTMDIEFFTEGNYALEEVYLVDSSNKKSESEKIKEAFTIDGTTPVLDSLKYSIREKEYSDYKFIGREILKVTFHVEDEISGIHSVKLSYLNLDNALLEYTAYSSGNGNYICNIPSEGKDFKGTVKSIFVEDKNDNILEYKINKGVIIDQETKETNQLLEVSIDDNTASFKKNIYNKDIRLQLRAADTFSGLKNIAYSINGVNQEMDFSEKNASLTYEWSNNSAKLAATKENEGEEIKVRLSAEDNAGNTKEISRTYVVDVTKPEIDIQFEDNSSAQYFNSNRKAVITIRELHLDVADIEVSITKDGKKSKIKPDFATTDNETYVAEVKFSGDADYDMTVSCTDMAGNVAKKKTVDEFTIDKTDPQIKVSFDNNHAVNEKYYAGQRTATITVEEHNFDSQQVNIEIGASLDGAAIAAPSVSSFTSEGDVHTAHVTFAGDGSYTMSCRLSDLAGNDSAAVEVQEFVIDRVNPEITISGIEEGMSYNGEILPVINISDLNFNASEVNIALTGLRSGTKTAFSIARAETDKVGVYRYEDFPHVIENDDYYILKASAHDMAGNLIEKTVEFRVNRFGSNYFLDEDTQRIAEQYYTNMNGSIVFVEENVDEISERELSYSKEGDIVYLEEGKDYTVGCVQGEDRWNTYHYSIDTAGITQDGIYSFMLYSKDTVGNEMNNKSKNVILDICLDRTAPLCTVSGVENDGVYAEAERQAVIEVYDNISLDRVCVYLNGQETIYAAADIADNTILLALKEASKKQELRVVCYDSAGNVYDTASDGNIIFTLSTNALTTTVSRITNNMTLKIIIVTVSIALVILFFVLMLRKSKKEKQ